jgi:long-chain acyl-CoA synthetase
MKDSMTLPDLISSLGQQTPEKTWFISTDTGKRLSFGELDEQRQRLGRQFAALGLKSGDKVSVYMPNCEHTAVLLLGIMANGLVANPINLMCQPSQLRHILWHSDTRLVFTTRELGVALTAVLPDIERPIRIVWVDTEADRLPDFADAEDIAAVPAVDGNNVLPDADALLMYTSGTTGVPKGVLLTHKNLLENARNITREHHLSETDRVLGSLPLYHINGLVVTVITPLIHGGSVAMQPRFSAINFWQNASRYECTWLNVVPTIISYLLNSESDREGVDLSRLRFCRSASSALPPEHHRQFEDKFGIGVIETMGLTETAAPAFSNPYLPRERKLGSVGKPSGMQAKVVDVDERTVPNGVHGEIVLSGQNVMRGYYKDPERTAEAFTGDGWLRTGDIGYQDDEGYFYITGRAKELIIKGGENIAPREIDEALIKHPSVLDAAAVGVPHPDYGQDVAVYLVLRENEVFDPEDMRRHCLAELGKYKSPGKYIVVDDLPRGPSGKVQRLKLLEL